MKNVLDKMKNNKHLLNAIIFQLVSSTIFIYLWHTLGIRGLYADQNRISGYITTNELALIAIIIFCFIVFCLLFSIGNKKNSKENNVIYNKIIFAVFIFVIIVLIRL